MKNIFLTLILAVTIVSLYAQESPPQVPPVKVPVNIKTPTLPQQPVKIIGDPKKLPTRPDQLPFALTSHTWNLIRWWITGSVGHSITDVSFKFLSGNNISCNLTTPEAKTALQSGTYSIHGNNVTIVLKKDPDVTMTCDLIYNSAGKTLNGTYSLVVLPTANPPAGYTAGTVTGDMKLEIKP